MRLIFAQLFLPIAHAALLNTCYQLALDIGTEKGTWMPPKWGASGTRATATPVVRFAADGKLKLVSGQAWDHLTIQWQTSDGDLLMGPQWETKTEESVIGGWSVEKDKCSMYFDHGGIQKDDIVLEPGRLWCTCGAWGDLLQKRGTLTIKQSKFGWLPFIPSPREASFIVGVFTAVRQDEPNQS